MAEDYYSILGVSRSASADEIKKAYRAAARKHHPDVNKAPDAAQKFSRIQNAYDVLSDEPKRKIYDQFGEDGLKGNGFAGSGSPWGGGSARGRGPQSQAGGFNFDIEDLSSMFDTFFGGHRASSGPKRGRRTRAHAEPAAPTPHDVHVPFLSAAKGGTEPIRISGPDFTRQIDLSIPAGVPHGAVLRLRGMGHLDESGDPSDLLVRVLIDPHELFRRGEGLDTGRSLDVFVDVPLTVAEATFGAAVSVPTLTGSVELKVPAGTASGKKLRLRGLGIKPEGGSPGDLYAVVQIVPPTNLSAADRSAIEAPLAKQPNPRTGQAWQ